METRAQRERKKLVNQREKKTAIVKRIIDHLAPMVEDMPEWEIMAILNEVGSAMQLRFRPFRTLGDAMTYRKQGDK